MKKHFSTAIIVLILLAGLSLLLYPTASDFISQLNHRNVISEYTSTIEGISEEEKARLLEAAYEYNRELAQNGAETMVRPSAEQLEVYETMLNVSENGVMGYVRISSINVSLPIYHGTSEAILQIGVGHLECSSLPVGGETSHSILSGHRGLPSAKLFTNLDKLGFGDIFTIHILGETFTYEVDDIQTILPEELQYLKIEEGQDYCTLLTCTPYGINTHRLLVRGHRIENLPEGQEYIIASDQTVARLVSPVWAVVISEIPIILAALIIFIIHKTRRKLGDGNFEKS